MPCLPIVEHLAEDICALVFAAIRELRLDVVVDEGIDREYLLVDFRVEVFPARKRVDVLGESCGLDTVF